MKWVTRERPKTDRIACPWLIRKFIDPVDLPGVDQAEAYDQSAESLAGNWFERLLEHNISTVRDARLLRVLDEIHRDRAAEPVKAGVVFGAGHMPAVVDHLCGQLGYIAAHAEWLTVAHRRTRIPPRLGLQPRSEEDATSRS